MSGPTLQDLNTTFSILDSEKKHDNGYKGSFMKPNIENSTKNISNGFSKVTNSLPSALPNDETNGSPEVPNFEVEYIDSENLKDLLSVESVISTLLERLDHKNWILVCEALNNVRQISIYHRELLFEMLSDVLRLIVKCLKNPRSAVCKTAIMASADIFKAYNDSIIESFDPLLLQLFLKSSQDKRFVCEAAERALITMTTYFSPSMLLPKLQPYLTHKNPRIRAKASNCFCRSVPRLGLDGIQTFGIDKLIQVAAAQLSDRLPESREAARNITLELQAAYEKSRTPERDDSVSREETWEDFCHSKLSALNAQAVLRVTAPAISKEGATAGC